MKRHFSQIALLITLFLFFLNACTEQGTNIPDIQTSYDTTGYESATNKELQLIDKHIELVTLLKSGRSTSIILPFDSILPFIAPHLQYGSESLKTLFTNSLKELSKASGNSYDPFDSIQNEGGTYGGYLFDEQGLEHEQILDKSSYIGLFYSIAEQCALNGETTHKYIALYGATPFFANSDIALIHKDRLSAGYAARRDKNTGDGVYLSWKKAVISMQGHQKAGTSHMANIAEERKKIFQAWEKAIMATVINYCYGAYDKFIMTNPTKSDLASGLHSVSEAIAFVKGFQTVNECIISPSQVQTLLTLLKAEQPSLFVTKAYVTTPNLLQAISEIQHVYGFTNQEIEDFKINWVTVQNRK